MHKIQPTSRRIRRISIAITGVVCWWLYFRSGVPSFLPWVTWSTGGDPLTIIVNVTRDGRPVSGIAINTESRSGSTGEQLTDGSGSAFFRPGELEVISIYIDHRQIPLRPVPPGEWFFLPSCGQGLTFHVAL